MTRERSRTLVAGKTDFEMTCLQCEQPMRVRTDWCGAAVLCPRCRTALRVPTEINPQLGRVDAERASLLPRHVFNLPCPRCECLLEAHTGMIGQEGACPTCTTRFTIPSLRRSGLPHKAVPLDSDEEHTAAPLHAFAGSGETAPQIVRRDDGTAEIRCPRCETRNPINASTCRACAAAFTLEASPSTAADRARGRSTASLIVGFISVILFPTFVPALLAIGLGWSGAFAPTNERTPVSATVGMCLGAFSLLLGGLWLYWVLN